MPRRRRRRAVALPAKFHSAVPLSVALFALALLLLTLEFFRPGYFLHDDNATWFSGAYLHDYRVLTGTGRLAVVNYYQYGGEPFLEQGQTGVLYPPVYLGELLAAVMGGNPRWAIEWIAAFHLLFGVAGFYLWLRQNRALPVIAALGGLAWMLQPFVMIVGASWVVAIYAAAWLPWIFWTFDRMLARPSPLSATWLGTATGLFFLQGYVQWVVYTLLFLAFYGACQLVLRRELRTLRMASHLSFAALVFVMWSAPLALPMLHAVQLSAVRAQPMDLESMLFYRVENAFLWPAQVGFFHPFMFGVSSAIFFCPGLVLFPWVLRRFFRAEMETRRTLFAFMLLGLLALIFSGRGYYLLSGTPWLDRFRWPFKIYLLAEFFFLSAFLVALVSWSAGRWRAPHRVAAMGCMLLVLAVGTAVSLRQHDGNFFSKTTLPAAAPILPPGMDPTRGRVIAMDDDVPEATCPGFYTHGYGTFYEVPSIGGYNPLVGRDTWLFGGGLPFPNFYDLTSTQQITPQVRAGWSSRGVRYWIADPHAAHLPDFARINGLRLIALEPDRMIYEDELAVPLAHSLVNPGERCSLVYSGNSILISPGQALSPVIVSVGPGDGWWYRADEGPWRKAKDHENGLELDFATGARQLEVSYFDPRFEEGLMISAIAILVLATVAQTKVER